MRKCSGAEVPRILPRMAKDIIYILPFLETFSINVMQVFLLFCLHEMERREFRRGTKNRNVKYMYLNNNHIIVYYNMFSSSH